MQTARAEVRSRGSSAVRGLLLIGACALAAAAGQQAPTGPATGEALVRTEGPSELLPLASALRDAWREQSEDMEVSLGAGLSDQARLAALASGDIDVAFAGRRLDLSELTGRPMIAHRIGVTTVVFAVHADVTVLDLEPADLCDIFSGKVTNWAAYGGPDTAIRPILRPESEPDTEVVRTAIPCMASLAPGRTVAVARTASEMRVALQSTSGAIGLTTQAAVKQSIVALRSLSIGSVSPSPANVLGGRYPLARPAWMITVSPPSPAAARFVAFVTSERGAAAISNAGVLPVRPDSSHR